MMKREEAEGENSNHLRYGHDELKLGKSNYVSTFIGFTVYL